MARLDPFIELMFKEKAQLLLLETGAAAAIVQGENMRPCMQRSLTTAQIAGACAEMVPAYQRETFSVLEPAEFEYPSPAGRVQVRVEPTGGGVRVSIEPLEESEKQQGRISMVHAGYHAVELKSVVPVPPAPHPEPARKGIAVESPPDQALAAIHQLLAVTVEKTASDLHLTTAFAPCLRLYGDIIQLDGYGAPPDERPREVPLPIPPSATPTMSHALI